MLSPYSPHAVSYSRTHSPETPSVQRDATPQTGNSGSTTRVAARVPRSRLDRPCDICRRHKHLCDIPVRGEPCVSCKRRNKECTFDMPPTGRKRRKKEDVEGEGEGAGGTTTNRSAKGNGSRAGQATKKERRESTTTTEYESQQQGMQDHEPEFVSMGYSGGARTMGSISTGMDLPPPNPSFPMTAMSGGTFDLNIPGPSRMGQMSNGYQGLSTMPLLTHSQQHPQMDLSFMNSNIRTGMGSGLLPDHNTAAGVGMGGGMGLGAIMPGLGVSTGSNGAQAQGQGSGHTQAASSPVYTTTGGLSEMEDVEQPIRHPPSLDPERDTEESHYLGSGGFSGLTVEEVHDRLDRPPTGNLALSFRQVSNDPRLPAFFVSHQSLLYGRGPNTGQGVYEAVLRECRGAGYSDASRSLSTFQRVTLPALPFLNPTRLESACLGMEPSLPLPYALIAAIISHTTSYLPQIRHLHKALWSHSLLGLEDEYRQPRLRTLQLALVLLTSRPAENSGQSDIQLARLIGAAHLLGLHLEPSKWDLPLWERKCRKRIWWAILIHDKWRALLFGRPSNLHASNYNVCMPVLDDNDWGKYIGLADRLSFESFIASCKLVPMIETILATFYTIEACTNRAGSLTRIATLEKLLEDVETLEASLPAALRWTGHTNMPSVAPTGVRSFQLSVFGVRVFVHRLLLKESAQSNSLHLFTTCQAALAVCQSMVGFLQVLSKADRELFWMPYSSHHISNCASLLIRIALRTRLLAPDLTQSSTITLHSLTDWLISVVREGGVGTWDVADAAMKRIGTLLLSAGADLPEVREEYTRVAKELGMDQTNMASSAEDLLLSAGLGDFDPTAWWGNDLSWLDNLDMGLGTTSNANANASMNASANANANANTNGDGPLGMGMSTTGSGIGGGGMVVAGQAEF